MRHKYHTRAFILARYPSGEDSLAVSLLTADFGLITARAQAVRKRTAKNAAALQTLCQSGIGLVRGKEQWRVASVVLERAWFPDLTPAARERAGRITALVLRLVRGEAPDPAVFRIFETFLAALESASGELQDAAEVLTALRLLHALGLDAGALPGGTEFGPLTLELLAEALAARPDLVKRVNRGIAASHL
jgi:recombinational DNA repair protein (RecF pathway)